MQSTEDSALHYSALMNVELDLWQRYIAMYEPAMLVWIDETGCDQRSSLRRYRYSIRGIPPHDHRLLIHGIRYSAIPVMSLQGIHDVQVVEGTVNGEKFESFCQL